MICTSFLNSSRASSTPSMTSLPRQIVPAGQLTQRQYAMPELCYMLRTVRLLACLLACVLNRSNLKQFTASAILAKHSCLLCCWLHLSRPAYIRAVSSGAGDTDTVKAIPSYAKQMARIAKVKYEVCASISGHKSTQT